MKMIPASRSGKFLWLWLIPIIFLAAALGTARLNIDSFWLDEVLTVHMSGGPHEPPISLVSVAFRAADFAWPPLHNWLLVLWAAIFGWSEFSLRLMSLYMAILSIAMIYRLGRDMVSPLTGLISAWLLGSLAFYLHYSHEGRGYTLYVLLTISVAWAYWKLLNNPTSQRMILNIVFVASSIALVYTHYVATTTLAALGLYHMLFAKRDDNWNRVFRLFWIVLAAYAIWLPIGLLSAVSEHNNRGGWDSFTIIKEVFIRFSNGAWLLLIALLIYPKVNVRRETVRLLWFWLIAALLLALAYNLYADFIFSVRHVFVLLPPLIILAAMSIETIRGQSTMLAAMLVTVWIFLGLWNYVDTGLIVGIPQSALQPAIRYAACLQPGDAAVYYIMPIEDEYANTQVMQYYLYNVPYRYTQLNQMSAIPKSEQPIMQGTYDDRIAVFIGNASQVVLFTRPDLSEIDQLEEFKAVARTTYPYSARALTSDGLSVDVFSQQQGTSCMPTLAPAS